MHDLNYFRDHLDLFADMAKKRGAALDLDGFRKFDKERRELITENERRKAQRNKASDEIARRKKAREEVAADLTDLKKVSTKIKESDEKITERDAKQREFMQTVPNLPNSSVPSPTRSPKSKEATRSDTPPKLAFGP